jgi:flavodoxin
MNVLIVYYSRSGITKTVSAYLSEKLGCQSLEIKTKDNRSGLSGYLKCGKETISKELPEIIYDEIELNNYDLIIIGTPVWIGSMSSPIRAFIFKNKEKFKQVAFFSAQGSEKEQKVFNEMEESIKIKPVKKTFFTAKEIRQKSFQKKADEFFKRIFGNRLGDWCYCRSNFKRPG